MTFPVNIEDTPSAKTGLELLPTTQQVSHMKKGFILVTVTLTLTTSYEFGYGLSYTTFDYSNLTLGSKTFKDKMTVSVTITNSGKTAEVVVSLEKSIDKPKEELKAFGKTNLLQPGESQTHFRNQR
jgi:beta-glucosidase